MGIKQQIEKYLKEFKYNVGFIDGDLQSVVEGSGNVKVNWLKHDYKHSWFADPFILDVTDDEIILLVEEWYDPIDRGRISKLVIDRHRFELKQLKVVLETASHLSFPAIDRKPDGIYIHPENSAAHCLEEYKYDPVTDCCTKTRVLSDLPLTDSACNDYFGEDLMFSTCLPDANGKELGIYKWDAARQRYELLTYYHFQENLGRMAGNFFQYNGKTYRPAQVCIKSYGDAVSVQEVSCTDGKWDFKELRRIYSPHPDYDLGFHTLNVYKGVIVVDAQGYRRAKLCRLLRKLKHMSF